MTALTPGAIRAILDRWLSTMPRYVRREWESGARTVYVGDNHYVSNDPRPGWLVVDGRTCYSAAWL